MVVAIRFLLCRSCEVNAENSAWFPSVRRLRYALHEHPRRATARVPPPWQLFVWRQPRARSSYLSEHGVMLWSIDVDPGDWRPLSPDEVVQRILAQLEKKHSGIVLMHDVQPQHRGCDSEAAQRAQVSRLQHRSGRCRQGRSFGRRLTTRRSSIPLDAPRERNLCAIGSLGLGGCIFCMANARSPQWLLITTNVRIRRQSRAPLLVSCRP